MASKQFLVDIDLSKNQLLNAVLQNLAVAPSNPFTGQPYFNTTDNTAYLWNGTEWVDILSDGITNLGYIAAASQGTITSDTGDNAIIPAATTSDAGLMTSSDKSKLDGIEDNAKDDQSASEVPVTPSGNLGSTDVQSALQELQSDIDTLDAETNNLGITHNNSDVDISIENGDDITIETATMTSAGVMSAAGWQKLSFIEAGAQVNVPDVVTSISLAANILTYTDEDGNDTDIDLSLYLDDTNLARLTSGTINGTTGIATFTRDDSSTFTIDMSAFLDAITLNDTLTSTSTTEGLTANQGKVLKDLIDAINAANTGDETSATTSNEGIVFLASQAEVDAGTNEEKVVTPDTLQGLLGYTGTLSTTLKYTAVIGNGALTSIPVTHNIGEQYVNASVYDAVSGAEVGCVVEATSASVTTFKFNTAPTTGQYRVVITG